MSKKRDPIVAVVNYFTTVDLALAQQGLELAKEIVRKRLPRSAQTAAPTKRKPRQPAVGAAVETVS